MAENKSTRKCSVDGCDGVPASRKMCNKHYRRMMLHGDPHTVLKQWCNGAKCIVDECDRPGRKRGWCEMHYQRWRTNGSVLDEHQSWVIAEFDACLFCDEPVTEQSPHRRYCSKACAVMYSRNKGPRGLKKSCIVCGVNIDFEERHKSGRRRYSNASTCGRHAKPSLRRYVDLLRDRDGGGCHLCDTAINFSLSYPDRMSPSVDHVVPRSHGGPNNDDNYRLAHLHCNVRRQNRTVDEYKASLAS